MNPAKLWELHCTATHVQFSAYWRHNDIITAVQLDLRWHGDCHGDGDVKGA